MFSTQAHQCGGLSQTASADDRVQKICDEVRDAVEEKGGRKYNEYTAVSFARQVVNGVNYFVKIHVGDGEHVHVVIYQPADSSQETRITSLEAGKTAQDAIHSH